jgi:hypothetical protein
MRVAHDAARAIFRTTINIFRDRFDAEKAVVRLDVGGGQFGSFVKSNN